MTDLSNSNLNATSISETVSHFISWQRSAMLRGGRVTKFKGQAASYSPELGLVNAGEPQGQPSVRSSTIDLMRGLLRWTAAPMALAAATASPAYAQDACVQPDAINSPDVWVCEDNGPAAATTQSVTGTVLIEDGFEVNAGGNGLYATNGATSGLIIDQANGTSSVIGANNGIDARNGGTGVLSITSGDASGTAQFGILAYNYGTDLTIDSSAGSVSGGQVGIYARNAGTGALSLTTADVTGNIGIFARNLLSGTDLIIDTSAGSVSGGSGGIFAPNYGTGSLSITTGNVRGTLRSGILAFNAYNSGTDLTIDTSAGSVSGGSNGIVVNNAGTGALALTTADVIGTTYGGIFARNSGTDLTIDTSAGSVSGNYGILARNSGSGTLSLTTADVTGGTQYGIYARNIGTDLIIDSSAGDVSGGSTGLAANNQGTGALSITTDDVTGGTNGIRSIAGDGTTTITLTSTADIVGTAAQGIWASSTGAAASITVQGSSGTITGGTDGLDIDTAGADIFVHNLDSVIGNAGDGIDAVSNGGNITITEVDTILGTGGNGILADSDGGDITIMGSGLTGGISGTNGAGITADARSGAGGAIAITGNGNISGTVYGIIALTDGAGSITIDSSAGNVSGGQIGIYARNAGAGALSLTTADVTGTAYDGIFAINLGTNLTIDSSGGSVSGARYGIRALNFGGALSITSGNGIGSARFGISAFNRGTDLIIDSSAGSVSGGGSGIDAVNSGTGALSITSGDVTGVNYRGIFALISPTGTDLIIDSAGGSVSGGSYGIQAQNDGTGSLFITTGNVRGTLRSGILAFNSGTDLTIDSSAGSVSGGQIGIYARNAGTGALSLTTADVIGTTYGGISARNSGTDLTIDTSAGAVTGGNYAIVATNFGTGKLSITAADVRDARYFGIYATNSTNGSNLTIDTVAGHVSAGGSGISVGNYGSGALSITTGDVSGNGNIGINARNSGTHLLIDSSAGRVIAGYSGIYAHNSGTGVLSITTADVTGQSRNGVLARASGGGDIAITNTGAIAGAASAVAVSNFGGGSSAITNNGTLFGGAWLVFAEALNTGAITVNNTGMMMGAVSLGIGDDIITNQAGGTFFATADSDFGSGVDLFDNFGMFAVDGNVTLSGLEQFNNRNLITMVDGAANDSLTLPGGYLAASDLALDIDFAAGIADMLIIGGPVSGSTMVSLNQLSPATTFGQRILLVDANVGTAQDAFLLTAGSQNATPFQTLALEFDAAAGDFMVFKAVTPRIFEASKLAEAAQSSWYHSADAWSDHRANARFGAGDEPLWLTFYGATSNRDETYIDPTGFATADAVLDYQQDYFGFQTGVDLAGGDNFDLGLTAGYLSSRMNFAANGNGAAFDVFNLGASASYSQGGFFADALIKYDFISGKLRDPTQGAFSGDLDGKAYGGHFQLGYRLGSDGFYLQPHGSIEFQQSNLDDLVIDTQTFEFDTMDGLRGIAGLRLGGQYSRSNGTVLGYYLGASAVHEFKGESAVRFLVGSETVAFANNRIDTYGHIEAGVTLDGKGPVSGFFQVEGDISGHYTSIGGRAGLRIAF